MEIVEITQSDDLMAVARKCAVNFRQIAWYIDQAIRKQGRIDVEDVMTAVSGLSDEITEMVNITMPNEVAAQIAAQNIPGQVEEATTPPVGTYVLADSAPSHAGTTWQQVGTVSVTGGGSVPLWHRTN